VRRAIPLRTWFRLATWPVPIEGTGVAVEKVGEREEYVHAAEERGERRILTLRARGPAGTRELTLAGWERDDRPGDGALEVFALRLEVRGFSHACALRAGDPPPPRAEPAQGDDPLDPAEALHSPEYCVRERACVRLGAVGGPAAAALLLEALGDLDPGVRCQAEEALVHLDRGPLYAALLHPDLAVREGVGRVLGRDRGRLDLDRLAALLTGEDPDAQRRVRALLRAGRRSP
jgi:hypothetical protein